MVGKWLVLLGIAAALSACAHPGDGQQAKQVWNGGVWNSVLGYVGPYNVMADGPKN